MESQGSRVAFREAERRSGYCTGKGKECRNRAGQSCHISETHNNTPAKVREKHANGAQRRVTRHQMDAESDRQMEKSCMYSRPLLLHFLFVIARAAGANILPTRGAKHLSPGRGRGGVTKRLCSSMLIWLLAVTPVHQFVSEACASNWHATTPLVYLLMFRWGTRSDLHRSQLKCISVGFANGL